MRVIFLITLSIVLQMLNAQSGYWQQEVDYKMDINMDVEIISILALKYLTTQTILLTH